MDETISVDALVTAREAARLLGMARQNFAQTVAGRGVPEARSVQLGALGWIRYYRLRDVLAFAIKRRDSAANKLAAARKSVARIEKALGGAS